ncbi:DUF2066 domain-containing protein [Zavarzinia compransoris]|uniref:DUF2066 domain-containing protein n=1 Tax=Zavarzinia marina TaxID=2911065 RepID=UPI001F382FE9|nr:DUF2066 domain-containing protein [Zavarzinia marina]MCF4164461.1 DUF2066 domain-containing protein [Zavarzinia marina]
MSMKRLLPLVLFLHAVVFAALGAAANAQTFGVQPFAETYLVEGVPAKASAESPLAARDAALAKAQREALDILLKRLVGPGGEGRLPAATDQLVFKTMLGFEVKEEKTSPTTYSALISVEFRKAPVDELLAGTGVAHVEAASKPVVVVPVFVGANGYPVLFDGDNPWRDAWFRHDGRTDPQPLVVPIGDLPDIQALSPQTAQSGDRAGFAMIAEQYDASGALLATALLAGGNLSVTVAEPGQAPFYNGAFEAGDFDAAVTEAAAAIQNRFRSMNEVPAGPPASLEAKAVFTDLRGWRDLKSAIEGTPAVRRLVVRRLLVGEAAVTLNYQGDPASLRAALAQRGVALETGAGGGWALRAGAPTFAPFVAEPPGFGAFDDAAQPPPVLFPPSAPPPEPQPTPDDGGTFGPDFLFQ